MPTRSIPGFLRLLSLASALLASCSTQTQSGLSPCGPGGSCPSAQSCSPTNYCFPSTTTTPGAPTQVLATASNTNAASVSWTAPASDGGSPILGYVVSSSPGVLTASTTGALTAIVSGLTVGTTYTFTVHTITAYGVSVESAPSAPLLIGPPPPVAQQLVIALAPTSAVAGQPFYFSVSATDLTGAQAAGYRGTLHFTSTDPNAQLPADYTFTSLDAGAHVFQGFVLETAGAQTITAADAANSLSATTGSITVAAGAAGSFTMQVPATAPAGSQVSLTVHAFDAEGNPAVADSDTLTLASTDSQAQLPATVALHAGSATFSVTFLTAGPQTIALRDNTALISFTSQPITVTAGVAVSLALENLPASAAAGGLLSPRVHALDVYGNSAAGYLGTVHFTSSDGAATLPAAYTFTAADQGLHVFTNGLAFVTNGNQGVTAADNNNGSLTSTVLVNVVAATVQSFVFGGLTGPIAAGATTLQPTLSVVDQYGNPNVNYRGTVHFTSTDARAFLPPDTTFNAQDLGVHPFTQDQFVFLSAGMQTVTATDTVNTSLAGTSQPLQVIAGPSAAFVLGGLASSAPLGIATPFTLSTTDAYGNPSQGYAGTVRFTSSDGKATLPAPIVFTAASNTASSSIVFGTQGNQTLTATDSVNARMTVTSSIVNVLPPPAAGFVISGLPGSAAAGQFLSPVVTAVDGQGNPAAGYTGTVHFTSSDPSATLPPDTTFNAGDLGSVTLSSSLSFATAGAQTLTATDVADGVSGQSGAVQVSAGPLSGFTFTSLPGSSTAGQSFSIGLQAIDSYGNPVLQYDGAVRLTSSDPQAQLPDGVKFAEEGGGAATAQGIILATAGNQTLTATDTGSSAASTSSPILVGAGAECQLLFVGLPASVVAGTPFSGTVSAVDAYQNVVTTDSGALQFSSTDSQASLPGGAVFTAGAPAVLSFNAGFTLGTAGIQTLSVTDGTASGTSGNLQVSAGAGSAVALTGLPANVLVNQAVDFTVEVADAYGNPAIGTVTFTSSDSGATFPAPYTFNSSDNGSHTFSPGVTFTQAGTTQSLTATLASGASSTVSVSVVNAPSGPQALDPSTTAVDAFEGQDAPAMLFDGTNYFAVWQDEREGGQPGETSALWGARFSAGGTLVDTVGIEIARDIYTGAETNTAPAVAFDGTNYLVVWAQLSNAEGAPASSIRAARVSAADGTLLDPQGFEVAASTVSGALTSPAAAWSTSAGSYLVAWNDSSNPDASQVNGSRVTSGGASTDHDSPLAIGTVGVDGSTAPQLAAQGVNTASPDVAANNSSWVAVWSNQTSNSAFSAGIESNGALAGAGDNDISNGDLYGQPTVAFSNGEYLMVSNAWLAGDTNFTMVGELLDVNGVPLTNTLLTFRSGEIRGSELNPSVAATSTGWVAAWDDLRSGSDATYAAHVNSDGSTPDSDGVLLSADSQSGFNAIASNGSDAFVLWIDDTGVSPDGVFGAHFDADSSLPDSTPFNISSAANEQRSLAIASSGSGALAVWTDDRAGAFTVYGSAVSQGGLPTGAPFAISQDANAFGRPAIAFNGTNYLVTWTETSGSGELLNAAMLGPDGTLQPAGVFNIASDTVLSAPAVASDGANWVVAWLDGSACDLCVDLGTGALDTALIDGSGNVTVNSPFTDNDVSAPALSWISSGDNSSYLVAYAISSLAGNQEGLRRPDSARVVSSAVWFQPLGSNGISLAPPVEVSNGSAQAVNPAVAYDGTRSLIAWADGASPATTINGARVDVSLNVIDNPPLTLATGGGLLASPSLVNDGSGFVLAWEDDSAVANGGIATISAERFDGTAGTSAAPVLIDPETSGNAEGPQLAPSGAAGTSLAVYSRFIAAAPYGSDRAEVVTLTP